MGNYLSWISPTKSTEELQMVLYRCYATKSEFFNAISINANQLLAAGNELRTIHLYDLAADADGPQQTRYLEYTSGGVSNMIWITEEILAVGTTRGYVVVFSITNENSRLIEVCNVKAHGDGAARIPVECMDYCKSSCRLVTVGEGVGSLRIWNVQPTGILTPVTLTAVSTAYLLPNFVSFTDKGSQVLVGFSQTARIERFALDPFQLLDSRVLDEDDDHRIHQRMNSALYLESLNRLIVSNPIKGLRLYDASSFQRKDAKSIILEQECRQQLASIKGGSYIVAAGNDGRLQILRAHDASIVLKPRVPGRKPCVQAIHACTIKAGYELLAAASYVDDQPASYVDDQPASLTVWSSQVRHPKTTYAGTSDISTLRVIVLCALVSFLCHFLASTMSLDRGIISELARVPGFGEGMTAIESFSSKDAKPTPQPLPSSGHQQHTTSTDSRTMLASSSFPQEVTESQRPSSPSSLSSPPTSPNTALL